MATLNLVDGTGVVSVGESTYLRGSETYLYFENVDINSTTLLPELTTEYKNSGKKVTSIDPAKGEIIFKDADSTGNFKAGDLVRLTFEKGDGCRNLAGEYVVTSYEQSSKKMIVKILDTAMASTDLAKTTWSTKEPTVYKVQWTPELREVKDLSIPSEKFKEQEVPRINDDTPRSLIAGVEYSDLTFTMYTAFNDPDYFMIDSLTSKNAVMSRQYYAVKITRNRQKDIYLIVSPLEKKSNGVDPQGFVEKEFTFKVVKMFEMYRTKA